MNIDLAWLSKRVLLGQLLALAVSSTGVFTSLLVDQNRSFPLLQSITSYLWITAMFLPTYFFQLWKERQRLLSHYLDHEADRSEQLQWMNNHHMYRNFSPMSKVWKYAIIALVDLEANYVVVKAYQYTDMTSVQLLDCFTIPVVMILSFFFLAVRYSKLHLIGALIAVGGLAILIALDADGLSRSAKGPNNILGDMLCIVSSACYAISNVACEKLIKVNSTTSEHLEGAPAVPEERTEGSVTNSPDTVSGAKPSVTTPLSHQASFPVGLHNCPAWLPVIEYLALMPLFGLLFAIIQMFCLEWNVIHLSLEEGWTAECVWYQLSFGLSMVLVYSGMPVLFYFSSATFANLSLLTADVYSIIWNVTIFAIYPRWEFFIAYLVIVAGIVVFDTNGLEKLRLRYTAIQGDGGVEIGRTGDALP